MKAPKIPPVAVQCYLYPDEEAALESRAASDGLSKSEVMRRALAAYHASKSQPEPVGAERA